MKQSNPNLSGNVQYCLNDDEQSLRQYWDVFRRYRLVFILIATSISLAGLYYAYSLPNIYRSSIDIEKKSGFKSARQLLSLRRTKINEADNVGVIAGSMEVGRRVIKILKENINDLEHDLTPADIDTIKSLTADSVIRMHEFTIDKDSDTMAVITVKMPKSRKVVRVVAEAYAQAVVDEANSAGFKSLQAKEKMLLNLQNDKQREIKRLETELNTLRMTKLKEGKQISVSNRDNILPLLNTAEVKLQTAKLDLEMLIKTDSFLRKSMGIALDENVGEIEWVYDENAVAKQIKALTAERDEKRLKYTEKNPLIRKLTKKINILTKKLNSRKHGKKHIVYVESSNRNQVSALVTNSINMQRYRASIETLKKQIKNLRAELLAEPDLKSKNIYDEIIVLHRILTDLRAEYQQIKIMMISDFNKMTVASEASVGALEPSVRLKISLFSIFVGLLMACMAVFILNGWNNTVLNSSDLKRYIDYPVLGVIPRWDSKGAYINANEPDSSIGEIYSVLRNNIKYSTDKDPSSCLMIASAVQNEGKSHTSINLAISFALEGNSVLLMTVDLRTERNYAKLRRPEDRDKLGTGLSEYLSGNLDKENLIFPSYVDNLFVVPSGKKAKNPTFLLRSEKFAELIEQAKSHFDVIIMDAPASLPVVDSAVISNQVDGVLMVVEAGKTPINVLEQAIARLEHVHSPIIGAVVNKVRDLGLDSFYGSGYSYYPNYYKASYRAGYKATYKSTYKSNGDAT